MGEKTKFFHAYPCYAMTCKLSGAVPFDLYHFILLTSSRIVSSLPIHGQNMFGGHKHMSAGMLISYVYYLYLLTPFKGLCCQLTAE